MNALQRYLEQQTTACSSSYSFGLNISAHLSQITGFLDIELLKKLKMNKCIVGMICGVTVIYHESEQKYQQVILYYLK